MSPEMSQPHDTCIFYTVPHEEMVLNIYFPLSFFRLYSDNFCPLFNYNKYLHRNNLSSDKPALLYLLLELSASRFPVSLPATCCVFIPYTIYIYVLLSIILLLIFSLSDFHILLLIFIITGFLFVLFQAFVYVTICYYLLSPVSLGSFLQIQSTSISFSSFKLLINMSNKNCFSITLVHLIIRYFSLF